MHTSIFRDTHAEALFISDLQPSQHPDRDTVRIAISGSLRTYGSRGCAALVAQEYGEHPETATDRMAWARAAVAQTDDYELAAA
ncbi:MAG: hypothetical protein ACRDUA_16445 [Micromonosporaceae bacterium]